MKAISFDECVSLNALSPKSALIECTVTEIRPVSDDPRPGFTEERARYLNNPTAVFDPRDSKRNVLFPGSLLQVN